jgi:hypothetical protein
MSENKVAATSIQFDGYWNRKNKTIEENVDSCNEETESEVTPPKKLARGESSDRKVAIKFIFEHMLNSPEKNKWKSEAVIQTIMKKLEMPEGSTKTIVAVLEASLAGKSLSEKLTRRSRKRSITDFSEEGDFICNLLGKTNSSDTSITAIVNLRRIGKNPTSAILCRSAVRSYRLRSEVIETSARDKENMGSVDPRSHWNIARVEWCKQMLEQLRIGSLPADHEDV